jgi:glycosyltransferase involved in cell wall biosynthesis
MYAKYSNKSRIDLSYFCFDTGLKRIDLDGINVIYIPLQSSRIKSYINFFSVLQKTLKREKFDLVFHIDGKFTPVIRFLNFSCPMILDIRTGDLSNNPLLLWTRNKRITISTYLYSKVSVITHSLSRELNLNPNKTTIIPLGGELLKIESKQFENLKLIYIGSLENRNIHQTIKGLSIFNSKYPTIKVSYDIIGFGKSKTEEELIELIKNESLEDSIVFHGRMKHSELLPYLISCNVGIVYIPQKRYYDFQSSTKFYEYLLAGMPVIATKTLENKQSLKSGCGVLCEDSPESFANAIEEIMISRHQFNSESIKSLYYEFQWPEIVKNIWEPFILRSCN